METSRNNNPLLLILYGSPACGKLTVATALHEILPEFKVFHNHLVIDALLSLFPYGSPLFIKHRDQIWLDLISDAINQGDSVIFTLVPDSTISRDFLLRLFDRITTTSKCTTVQHLDDPQIHASGKCFLVNLQCEMDEILRRIPSNSRKSFHKITDVNRFQQLIAQGELSAYTGSTGVNKLSCCDEYESATECLQGIVPNLILNTTIVSPEENAKRICDALLTQSP